MHATNVMKKAHILKTIWNIPMLNISAKRPKTCIPILQGPHGIEMYEVLIVKLKKCNKLLVYIQKFPTHTNRRMVDMHL